jgi:ElaB/YqjD/DUF883 family membrane-anchored ribosome-binding protein
MSTITSLLDEKASRIAEQVDGLSRETAEGLHAAASSIRRGGRQGSKAIKDLAENTANTLDGAGSYVEKHNLKRAVGESRKAVRRYFARQYPVESIALAAGIGILAGFAIRGLTHACTKSAVDQDQSGIPL